MLTGLATLFQTSERDAALVILCTWGITIALCEYIAVTYGGPRRTWWELGLPPVPFVVLDLLARLLRR